jgi:benzoyl-CoA reductase/2-hydroxyglutaryl-CoA dehydratase subunit BcrC/BadD/HgdB
MTTEKTIKGPSQERPINRLKSMYPLRALVDETYRDTLAAAKANKPVAWSMLDFGFYPPILNALDIEAVYPENYGTVCAAAGVATPFLDRSEAEGFPTHLCGYAQNCFGYAARMFHDLGGKIPEEAPQGGMPKPMVLLASGAACDARFKWFQSLGRYIDVPVWTLESPRSSMKESLMPGAYEREVNFLMRELKDFVVFMEGLVGKKVDWDRFASDIDDSRAMDAVWYSITDELRTARPCPMHTRDHYSAMNSSLFRAKDPQRVKKLYEDMYDEVKARIERKEAGINRPEKYRIGFFGLAPWHALVLFDKLAERGWNFVREDYHSPRPLPEVDLIRDPLERLVKYRHREVRQEIEAEFPPEEAEEILRDIKEKGFSIKSGVRFGRKYQLDGVIFHSNLTCRQMSGTQNSRQKNLLEAYRVPSLIIEGDIVDARLFDMEGTMKKCEAFEETMEYYRDVRAKEGLEW